MADWKDDKDLGPWDFADQSNKFGYLNNPNWTDQERAVNFSQGLDYSINSPSQHSPCGHWHKARVYNVGEGRWVAALQQPNTPYIYLYNINAKAVIRVDTSENPPIVDGTLRLESTYSLDYDMGYGNPGAQRGGYCMNKSGTRLWYLFTESTGDRSSAELIEVDITSYYMQRVRSTIFPNLVPSDPFPGSSNERINDGCADNEYSYWPTNLVSGRIIKIRNSDHTIVDDHHFNYPIESCSDGVLDESIASIDLNQSSGKLYWVYSRDHVFCTPPFNACEHFIKANTDLSTDIESIRCGSGIHTPAWQNLIRIYGSYIFQHTAYHPSFAGFLAKVDTNCVRVDEITQEYIQNILGIQNNRIFTLMHVNSAAHPASLYCIDPFDMTEVSKLDVSYYTGQAYISPYDWDRTSVSALNQQTGRILIFRYNNNNRRNYAATFNASADFIFISDRRFSRVYNDATRGPFGEPQVWSIST